MSPSGKSARRPLTLAIVAALALTAFGALAYDSSWISPGQPVSAANLKAALDDLQSRLGFRTITQASQSCANISVCAVVCPAGRTPTGGGCLRVNDSQNNALLDNGPTGDGWTCTWAFPGRPPPEQTRAVALCAQ